MSVKSIRLRSVGYHGLTFRAILGLVWLICLAGFSAAELPLTPELQVAGQEAEIEYHQQASLVFSRLPLQFPESSKSGYWEFRAKSRVSAANKFARLINAGQAHSVAEARQMVSDGIGARLALDRTSANVMDTFACELAAMLRKGEIRLLKIENYHAGQAVPYLSPENIHLLRTASPTYFSVLTGDRAVSLDGYTSLHLDLEIVSGPRFELQVRGSFIQQLTTVSHLYYSFREGKPLDAIYASNPVIQGVRAKFGQLTEEQRKDYDAYLAQGFRFVCSYADGVQHDRAPRLPVSLAMHHELSVEQLAHLLKLYRLRDLYEDPGDFSERRHFLYFDSLRHLLTTQPEPVVHSIIGNVVQAGVRRHRANEISDLRRSLLQEIDGLNFVDVIVWEEAPFYKHRRRQLRSGADWPEMVVLPEYDETQALGLHEVALTDIYYMQDSADNETGEYTVLGNAKAIRAGTLKTDVTFAPIQAWRDVTGRVWALDHRRLAALELSGVVDKVRVEFVSKEKVLSDRFKFTSGSNGRSIIITVANTPLAYVISRETLAKHRGHPALAVP